MADRARSICNLRTTRQSQVVLPAEEMEISNFLQNYLTEICRNYVMQARHAVFENNALSIVSFSIPGSTLGRDIYQGHALEVELKGHCAQKLDWSCDHQKVDRKSKSNAKAKRRQGTKEMEAAVQH